MWQNVHFFYQFSYQNSPFWNICKINKKNDLKAYNILKTHLLFYGGCTPGIKICTSTGALYLKKSKKSSALLKKIDSTVRGMNPPWRFLELVGIGLLLLFVTAEFLVSFLLVILYLRGRKFWYMVFLKILVPWLF